MEKETLPRISCDRTNGRYTACALKVASQVITLVTAFLFQPLISSARAQLS